MRCLNLCKPKYILIIYSPHHCAELFVILIIFMICTAFFTKKSRVSKEQNEISLGLARYYKKENKTLKNQFRMKYDVIHRLNQQWM